MIFFFLNRYLEAVVGGGERCEPEVHNWSGGVRGGLGMSWNKDGITN